MAKMLTLDPALTLPLSADWSLLVSEAGRYAKGLIASIGLSNGSLQTVERVALTDPEERQAFALLVSYRSGLSVASVEPQMLAVFDAVEEQLRDQAQESEGGAPSQATRLVELAHAAGIELFHNPIDEEGYASIPVDGHTETYPLKVRSFRRRLARLFYVRKRAKALARRRSRMRWPSWRARPCSMAPRCRSCPCGRHTWAISISICQ